MAAIKYGGIEIDEDMRWQRASWIFERAGWAVFLLVTAAALAGLCGPGALSSTSASDGELRVSYDRFVRYLTPANVEIRIPVENGEARAWISAGYLDRLTLTEASPPPESVESDGQRRTYVFAAAEGATEIRVLFEFEPEHIGRVHGEAGLPGREGVSFWQFVYP